MDSKTCSRNPQKASKTEKQTNKNKNKEKTKQNKVARSSPNISIINTPIFLSKCTN